jgi:hypothetical protein
MNNGEPVLVRLLVARGSDGQTHDYALTADGSVVVDRLIVRRIEASTQHARSFLLITDTGVTSITSEHLCMLASGRVWTDPAQGDREAGSFARAYPSAETK